MKLKPLTLFDLEQIRQWRNQQLEILRTPFPLTEEQQKTFYLDVVCNRQTNARYWGVCSDCGDLQPEKECLHLIGMAGLENIQWENRLAEISLVLNPKYNLNIYGREALRILLHEAFMNMNLENVFAEVYGCNPNFEFWRTVDYQGSEMSILPNRKYWNGKYYSSYYLNFTKEAYLEHENFISKPL